ncbi:MAG: hypothetical protein HYR96_12780 [Deltaproteobacteria bacterium]|nr:hypothetical protein [Deltaproteobacteria bacterium]MBI3296332.1 hypothetical protein [Deltaproteobacteria bacterium]
MKSTTTESTLGAILASLGGETRIDLGLDRFRVALAQVGNPEKNVQTIVIAGTNGKGTTTLFVSNALKRAGLRVGTYLSPHLVSLNERFLCDMKPVSMEELDRLGRSLREYGRDLTYFEFLTLIYFVWAAEAGVEISVLEVGLGGRLDATNVTEPLATAITNIDLEHQAYLGNTREMILREKLGIIRVGVPLFTGLSDPALIAQCERAVSPVIRNQTTPHRCLDRTWDGQQVEIDGNPFQLRNPSVGTLENATLAYSILRARSVEVSLIQSAFAEVTTPGRFEVVPGAPRIILSGDHNPHGLQSLFETLDDLPPTRLHTLCAFSLDKPYADMYAQLAKHSEVILLTSLSRHAGKTPATYKTLGPFEPDPVSAFESLRQSTLPEATLLVTGSLYLVGIIRNLLGRYSSPPA